MAKLGKTIRLYLIDGTASGPIAAEIINWTGQAVLVPRAQLHELAGRGQLQRTGVYVLVGPDEDSPRERVYIGEGDEVFKRLKDHDNDPAKEFWDRAVAITSRDFNLTKAHGLYLESRIIRLAHEAGRAVVHNGTAPDTKSLPESDRADMEYFLEQLQLVLPVLGLEFLRQRANVDASDRESGERPLFVMEQVGAYAKAREIGDKFVVLKGSTARVDGSDSWTFCRTLRDDLASSGILAETGDGLYKFEEDHEFNSPSAAAAVIAAGNRNGRVTWKIESTDTTYAAWKEQQIEQAEAAAGAKSS